MYLLVLCEGMSHGFPAIVIPQLREDCSEFKITKEEESWIGDNFTNILRAAFTHADPKV